MQMQTVEDYVRTCLKIECLQFCDVIEAFRDLMMSEYQLDPLHYYSLAGFSWDCCLLHTGVALELLTDELMFLTIEGSIRGGLTVCAGQRFSRANYPEMTHGRFRPNYSHDTSAILGL